MFHRGFALGEVFRRGGVAHPLRDGAHRADRDTQDRPGHVCPSARDVYPSVAETTCS